MICLPPFQVQIPTLYSQKSPVYVPPSKWEAKFHTHTVQETKITVLYILIFSFFIWDGKTKYPGPNNDSKHSLIIYSWFEIKLSTVCCNIAKLNYTFISYQSIAAVELDFLSTALYSLLWRYPFLSDIYKSILWGLLTSLKR